MKIIGIILFVILLIIGIVILVAALALFVPVRYKIRAVFQDDEKSAVAKFRWLLGLVSVTVRYTGKPDTVIRILGLRTDKVKAFFSKFKRKKKRVSSKKDKIKTEKKPLDKVEGNSDEKTVNNKPVNDKSVKTTEDNSRSKKKKRKDRKFKNIFKKISDLHIRSYWDILRSPDNKAPFSVLRGTLWKIVKHSSPKKVQADLIIGTGDPCNTGLLFGFFGMMLSFIPEGCNLTPDFYEKRLEGKLYIKGRIRMVVLLHHVIKIMMDKELKRIKKDIDKVRA